MTHLILVEAAYRWLLKRGGCGVAFKEFRTGACNGEFPDVIGFCSGPSTVVECKVSRSDFFADRNKLFRKHPELGMGRKRYYCCPEGLIKVDELPEGWGLLYVGFSGKIRRVHQPLTETVEQYGTWKKHYEFTCNIQAEHGLMYSALRRLHIRGRIDEVYDPKPSLFPENTTTP